MLRRHARAACTALATAGMALAGLQAGSAAAAPDDREGHRTPTVRTAAQTLGTDSARPELLDAMRRDLGLTRPQALTRLANEAEAGATAARLHQDLGGAFAGAWVDGAEAAP